MKNWTDIIGWCFGLLIVELIFYYFEFGSRLSIIAGIAAMALVWVSCIRPILDVDEDSADFYEKGAEWLLLAIGFFVFASASLWDPNGYCDHQRKTEQVELGQTLEDRFKGRTRTDFYITGDKEACLSEGWDYVGRYEAVLVWASGLVAIPGLLLAIFLAFLARKEKAELGSTTNARRHSGGRELEVYEMSVTERITAMRQILERVQVLKPLYWDLGDFIKFRPPAAECSNDQLREVEKLLLDMQSEFERVRTTREEDGATLEEITEDIKKRNVRVEKSMGPIQRELKKRLKD